MGDSYKTEWTFVQKQCSFVFLWRLEVCWGLAWHLGKSAYTAGSFPSPPITQEQPEDTAGRIVVELGPLDGGMILSLNLIQWSLCPSPSFASY